MSALQALLERLQRVLLSGDGFHVVVETALLAAIVLLLLRRSFQPEKKPLTEKEIDALCEEWQPEPLVPPLSEEELASSPPVLDGPTGPRVRLVGGAEAVNLVSCNFLGLANSAPVEAACVAAIQKYGVGSCGPRGFYGTIDVHLELEAELRRFAGTEDAMIYSYDVATPASAIPAFAKRGDLLLVDEGVSFALQSGVALSRSTVRYWRHNDMAHLQRLLEEVAAEDAAAGRARAPNRRFIVVEGLYANWGDLAPLEALAQLKRRFKYRLLVDESLSFGTLPGASVGSALEHAGLPSDAAEIVTGSLGNTLGSVGGFCLGSRQVISHQRLNASGYCFSASLPPYLAAGALAALRQLAAQPPLRERLARNAALMRSLLGGAQGLAPLAGPPCSPLIHLRLAGCKPGDDGDAPACRAQEALLGRVCARALADGATLLSLAKYSALERRRPPPSIRVAVSAAHSEKELRGAAAALRAALQAEGVR